MHFEWSEAKSALNEEKHGVSLEYATELWNDDVVTLSSPRKGEARKLSIGRISGEYWTVVWEPRTGTRRLISARLSTVKERSYYDQHRYDS